MTCADELKKDCLEDLEFVTNVTRKNSPAYKRTEKRLEEYAKTVFESSEESDKIEDVKEADYPAEEYHKLEWENKELRNAIVELTLENLKLKEELRRKNE